MSLARRASVPLAAMLLIVAAGALLYAALGYRGAQRSYDAATAAPVVGYVVSGLREETLGRGRTRRTDLLLDLTRVGHRTDAPATAKVVVTRRVYKRSAKGDRWNARIVNGEALFDPRRAGVASENRLLLTLFGGLFAVVGALVLRTALRNRG